jgi:hypothetical protein
MRKGYENEWIRIVCSTNFKNNKQGS